MDAVPRARVGRAVGLMAASLMAITGTAVAFVNPGLFASRHIASPVPRSSYHVTAVDFVSPTTGWVVANLEVGDRAFVLHTTDRGATWSQQLSVPTGGSTQYFRFFDTVGGVFALVGSRPVLYRTDDAGRTWTTMPVLSKWTTALSWSFIDADHGWILADPGQGAPASLYRTVDGGWRAVELEQRGSCGPARAESATPRGRPCWTARSRASTRPASAGITCTSRTRSEPPNVERQRMPTTSRSCSRNVPRWVSR